MDAIKNSFEVQVAGVILLNRASAFVPLTSGIKHQLIMKCIIMCRLLASEV